MRAIIWVVEGSWPATIDTAATLLPASAEITLLYVIDPDVAAIAHGAFAGLIGRHGPGSDPGLVVDEELTDAAEDLLADAADRLGRPADRVVGQGGKIEHEVVDACEDADVLVMARDGDTGHAGPKSFGRAGRFVVDHAPTLVVLAWPVPRADISTRRPPHHGPPHAGHRPRHPPPK